ncbi:hypothetical protein EDB19DRAFT_1827862 [Suillus lakei]|nr:hypothetical protein EDB19DRAFT_1827862 [Suillus lakei]
MFVTPPPWHPGAAGRGEKGVVTKTPDIRDGIFELCDPISDLEDLINGGVCAYGCCMHLSVEWKWWVERFNRMIELTYVQVRHYRPAHSLVVYLPSLMPQASVLGGCYRYGRNTNRRVSFLDGDQFVPILQYLISDDKSALQQTSPVYVRVPHNAMLRLRFATPRSSFSETNLLSANLYARASTHVQSVPLNNRSNTILEWYLRVWLSIERSYVETSPNHVTIYPSNFVVTSTQHLDRLIRSLTIVPSFSTDYRRPQQPTDHAPGYYPAPGAAYADILGAVSTTLTCGPVARKQCDELDIRKRLMLEFEWVGWGTSGL